ncbi:MAG: prolipoprotein diacylglyceryl transferase [Rikenellaceae bacterium]|jgi:prolipoprotein diacylglyceryl transferase|nr:prolipoprotein diacylglyceryl transferase [Rikenellaceae bacterium]
MQLLSVTWNVDPVIFSIEGFGVRYYGLTWAIALGLGVMLFGKFIRREGLSPKLLDSIFWYGALSTIIGARLGHCFFYEAEHYLQHPWQLLNLRQGGMASHGAAIGLLLGLWMFSRKNKMPYIWSLDRIMIAVCIGGAFVRLGNLMNSEIYGTATSLPWGFIFVRDKQTLPMHPTQIYEALCYLAGFGLLSWLYFKRDAGRRRPWLLFGTGLTVVFATRFLIEYVKNPQEAFEQGMALNMGQWLSIPFVMIGAGAVWYSLKHKISKR